MTQVERIDVESTTKAAEAVRGIMGNEVEEMGDGNARAEKGCAVCKVSMNL